MHPTASQSPHLISYPFPSHTGSYPPPVLLCILESYASNTVTALVRPCHLFDARVSVSCAPCSSEQSAKAKTQKELFKTLKDLKMHLPSEKRSKGKSSTINTLKYALRCVKQVKGKTCFHWHFFHARTYMSHVVVFFTLAM